MKELSALKK
jgi:hypothetical protein